MRLILASASPRRRELLARCGVPFVTATVEVAELTRHEDPLRLPQINAERKAGAVSEQYPDDLVLGADTVILFNGTVIGKPRDPADAAAILRRLSGQRHQVVTGVSFCCRSQGIKKTFPVISEVFFRPFDETVIERYLAAVPVLDKAGAYALQDHGDWLVERVEGEPENVVGLPVCRITAELAAMGLPAAK